MQITRQADYATRAILYLARHRNGKQNVTSQIAKEQSIPSSFWQRSFHSFALRVCFILRAVRMGHRSGA